MSDTIISVLSVSCPSVRDCHAGQGYRPLFFESVRCDKPAFRDFANFDNLRCEAGHTVRANVAEGQALGHGPHRTRIGVAVAVTKLDYADANIKLIWGKRLGAPGTFGAGTWALPGGEVNPGESPEKAAAREVREEIGIEVDLAEVIALPHWLTFVHPETGDRWLCILVTVRVPRDVEVENREPDKHECWEWREGPFSPFFLDPMFEPQAIQAREGAFDELDHYA